MSLDLIEMLVRSRRPTTDASDETPQLSSTTTTSNMPAPSTKSCENSFSKGDTRRLNKFELTRYNEARRRRFWLKTLLITLMLLLSFSMLYVVVPTSSSTLLSVQLLRSGDSGPASRSLREQWTLASSLRIHQVPLKIAMISSFPPTQCGIATYATHSRTAIEAVHQDGGNGGLLRIDVIEMITDFGGAKVDPVVFQVNKTNPADYKNAARFINAEGYNIVMVEHEFGLYGGPHGAYLVELLSLLNDGIRVQLNVHTADLNAPPMMNIVFQSLLSYTNQVVGLSFAQCSVLQFQHPILRDSCTVIPHGVPAILSEEHISSNSALTSQKRSAKVLMGYDADQMLMISGGLLAPSKNLIFALDVFEILFHKHPKLKFIIAGVTHPKYEEEHGSYSQVLKNEAKKRGIDQRIDFVDRYLTDDEIQRYYKAADIYLSVYPGMQQTSSGMVPLAMAAGCAVVTSPFMHAASLIGQSGGGALAPLDKTIFAVNVLDLINDDASRLETAKKGARLAQSFHWEKVGQMYLDSFNQIQTLSKINNPATSAEYVNFGDKDGRAMVSNRRFVAIAKRDPVVNFGLWGMNDCYHEFLSGGSFLAFSVTHNGRRDDIDHRLGTSVAQVGTDAKGILWTKEIIQHCGTDDSTSCETVVELKSEWSINEAGETVSKTSVSVFGDGTGRQVKLSRFIFGLDQISSSRRHQLVMQPQVDTVSATVIISTTSDPQVQLMWEGDPKHRASFESVNMDGRLHYANMAYDLSSEKSASITLRNTLHAVPNPR